MLVSLFLSMTVCLSSAMAGGPSLFPGDTIQVRLTSALDTAKNRTGDRFEAVVDRDIESNGRVVIPRGAAVEGVLKDVVSSGRLKRRSEMTLEIDTVSIGGHKQMLEAQTETRLGPSHGKHDGKFVGAGALLGLVVGGIAGGGKGAGIGALSGAAVGAGGAAVTGKEELYIPSETVMIFRLRNAFKPELSAGDSVPKILE
jgi:hypothetical protein